MRASPLSVSYFKAVKKLAIAALIATLGTLLLDRISEAIAMNII